MTGLSQETATSSIIGRQTDKLDNDIGICDETGGTAVQQTKPGRLLEKPVPLVKAP